MAIVVHNVESKVLPAAEPRPIDRNGRERAFLYDGLNRQVEEQWLDDTGTTIRSTRSVYDAVGQMIEVSDPDSTYRYTYDALGRQLTVDNAGTPNVPNVVLNYTYDNIGNILSVTDTIDSQSGGTNTYRYDVLNRMTQLTQSGSSVSEKRVDFAYSPVGQFESIARYSDLAGTAPVVATTYDYDQNNRLERLSHSNSTEEVAFYDFTYDAASRITRITDVDGSNDYSYNNRDELTGADHSDVNNSDETYSYDANGNRVTSSLHGSDYVTGGNNQLIADGVYAYEYDDEGNMTRQTTTATGDVRVFEWDYRNQLVAVIDSDITGTEVQRVAYTYDAMGRRIIKAVDADGAGNAAAETLHFVYDRDDVLLEFEGEEVAPSQRYLHGPQVDQVFAQENEASETLWHLSDHLGTVKDLANDTGVVVNHRTYDAYGNLVTQRSESFDSRYSFTGREFDEEIELHYYRARYYNGTIGQFISQDPIGFDAGDTNVSRYVFNSPVNYTDPSGLEVYLGFRTAVFPVVTEKHASLLLFPDKFCEFKHEEMFIGGRNLNGRPYAILSAFPEYDVPNPFSGRAQDAGFGNLIGRTNDRSDRWEALDVKESISSYTEKDDSELIRSLIDLAKSYDNSAVYHPILSSSSKTQFSGTIPVTQYFPTYNSNSYVSGLLSENGINFVAPFSITETNLPQWLGDVNLPYGWERWIANNSRSTQRFGAPLFNNPLPSSFF